jgi:hypothetical protein
MKTSHHRHSFFRTTRNCVALHGETPTSRSLAAMPTGGTLAECSVERSQLPIENTAIRKAEPGWTRFARFETKADQRLIFSNPAVSEVRSPSAKRRGSWGFSGLARPISLVCDEMMAERVGFEPTIRGYRIHTFQACAFDHSATAPHAMSGTRPSRAGRLAQGVAAWQDRAMETGCRPDMVRPLG